MNLRKHLDSSPRGTPAELAATLGISIVYLHQLAARQDGRVPSPALCLAIERATNGVVTRHELRPDDYWLIWPDLPAPAGMEV